MSETGSRKSVIGAGATFTGKLVKSSALDIHGEVNADVSTARLHLHEDAAARQPRGRGAQAGQVVLRARGGRTRAR